MSLEQPFLDSDEDEELKRVRRADQKRGSRNPINLEADELKAQRRQRIRAALRSRTQEQFEAAVKKLSATLKSALWTLTLMRFLRFGTSFGLVKSRIESPFFFRRNLRGKLG